MKRSTFCWITTMMGLMLSGGTIITQAETKVWLATGTNDWWTGANWSDGTVPQAGDDVVITNAGVGVILSNAAPASGSFATLVIGNTTSNSTSLIFTNWSTALNVTDMTIATSGIVTCAGPFTNAPAMSNRVYVVCANLTIATGGKIDVSTMGYAGGSGPAVGVSLGGGWGSAGGGNGGYGGADNTGNGLWFGALMAGNAVAPQTPGSGSGGTLYGGGGNGRPGGGAVRIDATGKVTVNGSILADGGPDGGARVGSGAGGSIFITCQTLAGVNGLIRADGGTKTGGDWDTGSGGGGRIAVSNDVAAQALNPVPSVRFSANGGARASQEPSRGGIGSIYLTDARLLADGLANILHGRIESPLFITNSVLVITNRWLGFAAGVQATVLGDVQIAGAFSKLELGGSTMGSYGARSYRFDLPDGSGLKVGGNLVVTNGGQLRVFSGATTNAALVRGALVEVAGDFGVATGCTVYVSSHPTNGASPEFRVNNFTLASNATINAAALGFSGAARFYGSTGGGNTVWGWGDGKGYSHGGAGSGGRGGYTNASPLSGLTYGNSNAPVLPGSGGGANATYYDGNRAGDGGGLIRLIATGRITLNNGSQLLVNGGNGIGQASSDRLSGGGSGGGVYLYSKRFLGESGAVINAYGGTGHLYTGGGGGGGRVAVWRQIDEQPYAMTVNADGGMGRYTNVNYSANSGAAGTIVWGNIPLPGTLIMIQ